AVLTVTNSPVTYDGAAKSAAVGVASSSVSGSVANILTGGAAAQTAANTYAVTADFVPDDTANYDTLVSQSAGNFVISRAAATVTLGDLTPTYDGTPKAASATTAPAGLAVDLTYDGSPAAPTDAGSYAVVGTVDDVNYQGTASGALVIAPAAITVTADAKTKSAGAPDPALTWQVTSGALAPGDSLTGALTRDAGETAGTYAIRQGTLTAGPNYDLTYAGANLTITAGGAFAVLYTGPNPVIAQVNDRAEITVSVVNALGEVDYQWYKVSDKALAPILGEITPTLVFGHAAYADAGSYVCEASNQGDTVLSPEIELVIEGTALPAAGGIGLAVAALAAALAGARALRRRK
ncbi:MAG TPA: MBG domain-containing protein, partial [Candidatus Hydrogenedentes bacterium]|nr:MBG domain-containing protein [Candidatus Hydrogenedentota bacterium]